MLTDDNDGMMIMLTDDGNDGVDRWQWWWCWQTAMMMMMIMLTGDGNDDNGDRWW